MRAETTRDDRLARLAHSLGTEWSRLRGIAGGQPVIRHSTEGLLAQLCPAARLSVEAVTGRRVVGSSYRVYFAAGRVMCVFKLG
jgi:hypothetical protein